MSVQARPWREPTVYVGTPSVRRVDNGRFELTGTPAMYGATVSLVPSTGRWEVVYHTGVWMASERFLDAYSALQRASYVVGTAVGKDWRLLFSPQQRIIIGRQLCPYDTGVGYLCGRSIEVGSVWCLMHPWGVEAT